MNKNNLLLTDFIIERYGNQIHTHNNWSWQVIIGRYNDVHDEKISMLDIDIEVVKRQLLNWLEANSLSEDDIVKINKLLETRAIILYYRGEPFQYDEFLVVRDAPYYLADFIVYKNIPLNEMLHN